LFLKHTTKNLQNEQKLFYDDWLWNKQKLIYDDWSSKINKQNYISLRLRYYSCWVSSATVQKSHWKSVSQRGTHISVVVMNAHCRRSSSGCSLQDF
jgi:hypothetical protein